MQARINSTMTKPFLIGLIFSSLLLATLKCQTNNEEKSTRSTAKKNQSIEDKQLDEIKKTTHYFCTHLAQKNFGKMAIYADRQTQQFLLEIKNTDDSFLNYLQFIQIDTCLIQENDAYCFCQFENNFEKVIAPIRLIHYTTGWLIHVIWNDKNPNPFIVNTSSAKRKSFPIDLPSLSDTLVKRDIKNAIAYSLALIHFPEVIVDYMEKDRWRTNTILSPRPSRLPLTDIIKWGTLVQQTEFQTSVSYSSFEFNANHTFTTSNILNAITFTFSPKQKDELLTYFQEIALLLTKQFGNPYNILQVPQEQYYQFQQLKWFVKGYNEELVLSSENNTVELVLQSIKKQ
jgi:hypothetical protein